MLHCSLLAICEFCRDLIYLSGLESGRAVGFSARRICRRADTHTHAYTSNECRIHVSKSLLRFSRAVQSRSGALGLADIGSAACAPWCCICSTCNRLPYRWWKKKSDAATKQKDPIDSPNGARSFHGIPPCNPHPQCWMFRPPLGEWKIKSDEHWHYV